MFARGTRPSVAVLTLLAAAAAIAVAAVPVVQPNAWTVCPAPGKFITCLLATSDALWVGTEDQSVWCLDLKKDPAAADSWQQFPTGDTKTDNVYGLAQDTEGRIWVGTQNQGVSVYNGKSWKNYGVIDGPIGEHVFSIAADPDPKRGTVWIATDHGLTSWTPEREDVSLEGRAPSRPAATTERGPPTGATGGLSASASTVDPFAAKGIADPNLAPGIWRSYTRGDGLPADQIYAVTVAANGRVWIGTECDGLAWSDPPYKTWTSIRAAFERSGDAPGQNGRAAIGFQPGLPSNLTNGLLALPDGTIAYSTNYGLGLSRDGGRSWTAWQGVSNMAYENYLRGLAADSAGGLWIATRHKGLVRLDLKTGRATGVAKPALPDDYVFDVAITRDGSVWAGTYGGGLARLGPSTPVAAGAVPDSALHTPQSALSSDNAAAWKAYGEAMAGKTKSATAPAPTPAYSPTEGPIPSGPPRKVLAPTPTVAKAPPRDPSLPPLLPAPAAPPTLDELNAMLALLGKVPYLDPAKQPAVVRLDDDWLTKGDCLGRYGRYWGCWCALCSPADYYWGAGPEKVSYFATVGPNGRADDDIRYWIHWAYTTNPNSLEIPPTYLDSRVQRGLTTRDVNRRQAEWDDHGETYPLSRGGPSLYCTLKIPAGLFCLSLYNFNKDGHVGANRYRDFRTSVRPQPIQISMMNISGFGRQQELGHGRTRDFWGGVYERYLVRGPTRVAVEVDRNHSFCTILAGVFLDLVDEEPVPYFHSLDEWQSLSDQKTKECESLRNQSADELAARFHPASSEAKAVARLFEELERKRLTHCIWWACEGRRFYSAILRWTEAAQRTTTTDTARDDLLARTATCNYQLGRFAQWEASQVAMGKKPARQIEKSLRWNGLRVDCRGSGFAIVNEALAETVPSILSGLNKDGAMTPTEALDRSGSR
jgi:sugar lactone lactonase YvrE